MEGVCEESVSASITGVSPDSPTVGSEVEVTADAGGCEVTTEWESEGSPEVIDESDESVTLKWGDTGQYDVTYTVTDEDGETATETVTVGITTESEFLPNFHVDGPADVVVILNDDGSIGRVEPSPAGYEVDSNSERWQHENDNYEQFDVEVRNDHDELLYSAKDVGTSVSIPWGSILTDQTEAATVFITGVGENEKVKIREQRVQVCRAFDMKSCVGDDTTPDYPPAQVSLTCDETIQYGERAECSVTYENTLAWERQGDWQWSFAEAVPTGSLEIFGADEGYPRAWVSTEDTPADQLTRTAIIRAEATFDFREGNFDVEDPGTKTYSDTYEVEIYDTGDDGGNGGGDDGGNGGDDGDGGDGCEKFNCG